MPPAESTNGAPMTSTAMAHARVVGVARKPGDTTHFDAQTNNGEANDSPKVQDMALMTHQKAAPSRRKRRKNTAHNLDSRERRASPPPKKRKLAFGADRLRPVDNVKHALLAEYYPSILTLRQYVLHHLPASSRLRRRKIAELVSDEEPHTESDVTSQLCKLLDTTLVGLRTVPPGVAEQQAKCRLRQWIDYSQRDDSHVILKGGNASTFHFQSEIIDFIIWLLFSRGDKLNTRPHHLLCDGFRRDATARRHGIPSAIHGLYSLYFNERVAALKQTPWPQLLQLLGKSGELIMINLLLDCSIFLHVDTGRGNYYQLSGDPIYEAPPLTLQEAVISSAGDADVFERKPMDISFVRSRMLYARAALNARGNVQFGLRHIHVLNRFPLHPKNRPGSVGSRLASNEQSDDSTHHIMMYMFPRQYGLHNAFTSQVDRAKTAQKFQDYTLREDEISSKFAETDLEDEEGQRKPGARVPKRLRGKAEDLVRRLQVRHARCSYVELLEHYCSLQVP
ncbi:hypothetical protein BD289DRAFT_481688 [Coniella lustricola]|uniref:Telomerase reverse transcriptase n=1 Tax=Coniella lustricola TaxID=2025994 RepID=A0A2T3ABE9_9PEZI|nr:hypothetical protein BD289DRAFT_481688 [Coniella lustricola]